MKKSEIKAMIKELMNEGDVVISTSDGTSKTATADQKKRAIAASKVKDTIIYKKQGMMENQQKLRLQKLAGLIIENSEEISYENYQDSDEMGYMEIEMENIASEEDLNLKYRSDFDIAFNKALDILKKKYPELNFKLIMKFKENMF